MKRTEQTAHISKRDMWIALALQTFILVTNPTSGGWRMTQICFHAWIAFWGGVLALRIRNKGAFTKTDRWLIRYGYLPLCVITFYITRWILEWHGYGNYL